MMKQFMSLFILLSVSVFLFHTATQARCDVWPYDPHLKPLSRSEVQSVIANPKTTVDQHQILISRAYAFGLLEDAVIGYQKRLESQPSNVVLRTALCNAIFSAKEYPDYKPQNRALWEKQQDALWFNSCAQISSIVYGSASDDGTPNGKGAKIAFCWRTLAQRDLLGVWGGKAKGVKEAKIALALDPNDPASNRFLAAAYIRTSEPSKAMPYIKKLIALRPKWRRGYGLEAGVLFQEKRYRAAFSSFKKANTLTPPAMRNATDYKRFETFANYEASKAKK